MKMQLVSSRSILISLFFIAMAWSIYSRIIRYLEIENFFVGDSSAEWLRLYADQKIDFCHLEWLKEGSGDVGEFPNRFSPSRKYRIEGNTDPYDQSGFRAFEQSTDRLITQSTFPLNTVVLKWAKNDEYLIYLDDIDMGDDWETPYLYIISMKTGLEMQFAIAKTQQCR